MLAANVKRLRLQKGYSLERLARMSGVGRDVLDQIELGSSTPTIEVLWSVATALGVPFSALLAAEQPKHSSRAAPPKLEEDAADGLVCRAVLPAGRGPRRTEVYELKLAAGATRKAAPRPTGSVDNLLVTSGSAVVEAGGARHDLSTGDSIIFQSDVERSYSNPGTSATTMYVVITYAARVG